MVSPSVAATGSKEATLEEAEQASSLHQLSDDPERFRRGADSKQGDEVTVAKSLQILDFLLELLVVHL